MAPPMACRRLFMGALVSTGLACSAGMQTLPKNWSADQQPECSESAAAPAMDITAGVAIGLVTLMAAAVESNCGFVSGSEDCDGGGEGRVMLTGTLLAAPFVASGVYGIAKGNQCEEAKLAHHAYITQSLTAGPAGPMAPVVDAPGPPVGSAAPGTATPIHPECDPVIAEWQGETDLGRQTLLYRDMPEHCRRRITRTVHEE